jgi:hypothetical protein
MGYDWRMNSNDSRFQALSFVPFGLLFIAISLQKTKRTELCEEDEECEIAALAGLIPPETCRPTPAMAALTDMRDSERLRITYLGKTSGFAIEDKSTWGKLDNLSE